MKSLFKLKFHFVVVAVFLCLLAGCSSKKEEKNTLGRLSKINEYQVVPLFSDDAIERDILNNHLIQILEKLGSVHISHDCFMNMPSTGAGMVISAEDSGRFKSGSIKIFAEGEIIINKQKAGCDVWTTHFIDPTAPYPVDTEQGIEFRYDKSAKSPDIKDVITQLVTQFAEQYRNDNPHLRPVFYIYDLLGEAT